MTTNTPINLPAGKIAALDLGDQWVGIALSDITRTLAKPFTTVTFYEYLPALKKFIEEQKPAAIVIGYPKTMRGTESDQTKKVVVIHGELEKLFPETTFVLWDERLSSKRAQTASPARTKEEKLKSHAIAAAFILDSYLSYLKMQEFLHS
jgi:putative Holliday junction resolvase